MWGEGGAGWSLCKPRVGRTASSSTAWPLRSRKEKDRGEEVGERLEEGRRKKGRKGVGRRKLETRESAEAGYLSGSYPGVGVFGRGGGTPLGRLGPGGSDHIGLHLQTG